MSLRIAFIYDFVYPYHVGGIERINKLESEHLAIKNHVEFFSFKWRGMKKREFLENGVQYYTYNNATMENMYRHRRRSIRKAILFGFVGFKLFWHKRDVLIIDQFPFIHIPVIKIYSVLFRAKIIMRVAEVWDRPYWITYAGKLFGEIGYFISKLVVGSADLYITNSVYNFNRIHQSFGIDKNRIHVFTPVIDSKLMQNIRIDKNNAYDIVFAGRLIKEKKLDNFIKIIKQISKKKPDIRAIIIGDGPEEQNINDEIKRNGLANNIKRVKPITKNTQLYSIIKSSKLFLNMSEREGLSMITLESVALGTPVIIPDYSSIPTEVSNMCIKLNMKSIPEKALEIIESTNRSIFIKNMHEIKRYNIDEIANFYDGLFKTLGIKDND